MEAFDSFAVARAKVFLWHFTLHGSRTPEMTAVSCRSEVLARYLPSSGRESATKLSKPPDVSHP